MTVQFFDIDVDPVEPVTLRVYLVDQGPSVPRTTCVVPLLQWIGDRFAATPRLDGLLRVEIVAINDNHVHHLLFDSAATSSMELLHPMDVLTGRSRRASIEFSRRIESGLSVVVLPGEIVGTESAKSIPMVNDIQQRLVWIEGLDVSELLLATHKDWKSTRTVADEADSSRLTEVIDSFISSVLHVEGPNTDQWLASAEVSAVVSGLSYVVD